MSFVSELKRRTRWGMLSIGLLAVCAGRVNALELAPYLESSANDKPQGQIGVSFQDGGLRLRAGLKVEVKDDHTETLPQLSSAFAIGEKLNIQTSVNLPDWNSGIDFTHATFDTRFNLRSPVPFVTRLDARIRHLANGVSHDTSVHFRSPVSFLDQLEGRVRRSPNGVSRYSLNLGFSERLSAANAEMPFAISGKATFEKMSRPHRPDTILMGMETVLTGIIPRDLGGQLSTRHSTSSNRLVLRYERKTGGQESYTASIAYDHSWSIREVTEIELSLKVHEVADKMSSLLDVRWQAQF